MCDESLSCLNISALFFSARIFLSDSPYSQLSVLSFSIAMPLNFLAGDIARSCDHDLASSKANKEYT